MYKLVIETQLTKTALNIVKKYFNNKKDLGGNDYIDHLIRVASFIHLGLNNSLGTRFDVYDFVSDKQINIEKLYTIALLHDLFEDTQCTSDYLIKRGFDEDIIDTINILTKNKHEDYFEYIKRIKQNINARIVKISDLKDNMRIERLNKLDDIDFKRLKKYWLSYKYLTDQINKI